MENTMSNCHERNVAELRKINEEGDKRMAELLKVNSEITLNNKKTKWLEFTMILALLAATIAATKIWL